MSINKLAGIIFANLGDEKLPELTAHRSLGSIPFGGKYRLIDFALSNMSNRTVCTAAANVHLAYRRKPEASPILSFWSRMVPV